MRAKFLALAVGGLAGAMPATAAQVVAAGTAGTTGATALYLDLTSELTASQVLTPAQTATFLGRPDDRFTGLGGGFITYDFGTYRLVNGTGVDLSVYEIDNGSPEFRMVDILVSADGINFFNVEATAVAAIDLAGDELHNGSGAAANRQSYDLGTAVTALGVSQFRYLRLDGTAGGGIGGSNGFDPDAVAGINFVNTASPVGGVPEPATWALMLGGFGFVGARLRRRGTVATVTA